MIRCALACLLLVAPTWASWGSGPAFQNQEEQRGARDEWRQALAARNAGEQDKAREILEGALGRYGPDNPFTFWIAIALAEIERDEEHWGEAFELLERAQEALDSPGRARSSTPNEIPMARAWRLGIEGEVWIDLGLPDLAAPLFEEERALVAALEPPDANMRRAVIDHELRLYLAEDDLDALLAAEQRLEDEHWFQAEPQAWRARLGLVFAEGLLEAELRDVAPRGEARIRLEELVTGDVLAPVEQRWARLILALALLDEGELENAQEILAELRGLLASQGGAEPTQPHHRYALGLLALEARHAMLTVEAGGTPAVPLEEHLARLERAWNDAFLARWAEAPVRSGGVGYLYLSQRHLVAQELIDLRLRLAGPDAGARAALEDLLRAHALGTLSRRLGAATPTLDEIREHVLPPQGGLLWWHAGRDRSFVFRIDRDGVACERIAPVHVLEKVARDLVIAAQRALDSGRDGDLAAVPASARAAADALLPPSWRARIEGWRGVQLVGLDGIGYLPFELLPAADGTSLGERLELGTLPSVPVGRLLAARAPATPPAAGADEVWIVADTLGRRPAHERWGLEALQLDEARLRSLADATGTPAHLLIGEAATAAGVRAAADAGATVLQMVVHGLFDIHRERPAGLLVTTDGAGDGELWADDVEGVDGSAPRYPPLVVLTACGTARGRLRRGDDGRGDLGAAFLLRGANTVVLSAAAQEQGAGLRIAEALHAGLARGESPAAALLALRRDFAARGARLDLLQASLVHALGVAHRPVFAGVEPDVARPESSHRGILLATVLGSIVLGAALLAGARRRRRDAVGTAKRAPPVESSGDART